MSWRGRSCCRDRKSTRLNSIHVEISYAVFCLKKKKNKKYSFILKKKKNKILTYMIIKNNIIIMDLYVRYCLYILCTRHRHRRITLYFTVLDEKTRIKIIILMMFFC